MTTQTITALFDNRPDALQAVQQLASERFPNKKFREVPRHGRPMITKKMRAAFGPRFGTCSCPTKIELHTRKECTAEEPLSS
jgi:hypothetical protein